MRQRSLIAAVILLTVVSVVPAQADPAPGRRALVSAPSQSLGFEAGRIAIPAIGLDEVMREGVDMRVINQGVAHWAGTALPGGHGNMVLAGHRTTYSRPFHDLDLLEPGDAIDVTGLDGQEVTYRVTETLIVEPQDIWIADWTPTPMLTMFACHPKGSARYRIVIRAELETAPFSLP